jgi:hypothetical protein
LIIRNLARALRAEDAEGAGGEGGREEKEIKRRKVMEGRFGLPVPESVLREENEEEEGREGEEDTNFCTVDVYFTEASNAKYVPRSIQVDLEPGVVDLVRSGPLANLFRPDTFVHGQSGAGKQEILRSRRRARLFDEHAKLWNRCRVG